ncbi:MAG: phosphatase PAP2 family protein [Hydrotalea sp.]|nr:phosphatase PAP2 family protein [Hydrotalea sp.]
MRRTLHQNLIKKFFRGIMLLVLVAQVAWPQYGQAITWREIDSPAFITRQDPYLINQVVKAGDAFQFIAPALMYGLVAKHLDAKGFWQATVMVGATVGTMYVIKNAAMRQRPNGASDYQSFPSGHAAVTMAPAAFVTVRYGFWESIPFWGMGIFTAYSRVAGQRHFITDTLGSTALSLLFAYLFVTPLDKELATPSTAAQQKPNFFVMPVAYDTGGAGVTMALSF